MCLLLEARQMYRNKEHERTEKRHNRRQELRMRMMALWNEVARADIEEEAGEERQYYRKRLFRQMEEERRGGSKYRRDSIDQKPAKGVFLAAFIL